MKANKFVKNHGIETSKTLISRAHKEGVDTTYFVYSQKDDCFHNHCWDETDVWLSELKRLVESWELVDSIGGLQFAKNFIKQTGSTMGNVLEQAIADVESCL